MEEANNRLTIFLIKEFVTDFKDCVKDDKGQSTYI